MIKFSLDEIVILRVKTPQNKIGIQVVSIHKDNIRGLTGEDFVTQHQLICLNGLGFAIVDAKLDKDGQKVYYYHNKRTAESN